MAVFLDQPLFTAQTALNTAGSIDLRGQAVAATIYIKGSNATVSAGAVTIEEADDPDFSGTWSALGSAITVVQNTQTAVHLTGTYKAVRARISTGVTGGGTVSARIVAEER
jgi:hypothetical protein